MNKSSSTHLEIATCPNCKAACEVGHDEDGQVYCAACRTTFKPQETKIITANELYEMRAKAKEIHMVSGWQAIGE